MSGDVSDWPEEVTLSRETVSTLADAYEDYRRKPLYAWFDIDGDSVSLVETSYAQNGVHGPDADVAICVPSKNRDEIRQAFQTELARANRIARLEARV